MSNSCLKKSSFRMFIVFKESDPIDSLIIQRMYEAASRCFGVASLSVGSSYNSPLYLLGEIEKDPQGAAVFAVDWNADNMLAPRLCMGMSEIKPLMEALESHSSEDSWEVIARLHRGWRGR